MNEYLKIEKKEDIIKDDLFLDNSLEKRIQILNDKIIETTRSIKSFNDERNNN